ncbi:MULTISPECIES: YbaB/EbfC family nucleoid-associated protein [Micromonospora]|uniref:YbaB/EbfC family DNA-binding protein n=1 Tax=Micromonospora sicca TaxID=2202420 RepID=A0A317DL68_9ACTN|nr:MULTISPECIES: YbaB/EbfC family nucleoid-associated protein [unclassified Micromonospora]MBM0227579.1 YbaB/EbfC family nucleoid-associated protein [Micromonospora sp. ATA51]PWR15112.1 hypothetical protein DKT69_12590 [Micromonospora sp. 4G51]
MDQVTEFNRLFEQTRLVLASMHGTAATSGADEAAEPLRAAGTAAEGQVEVVLVGQRVESVRLDPRVLRAGAELLGEYVAQAVNAALDDLRHQAGQAGAEPAALDPAALGETLGQLQDQSVRSMSAMSQALTDVVQRIQEGGR